MVIAAAIVLAIYISVFVSEKRHVRECLTCTDLGGRAMMARAHPKLALRPFLPADAPLLAEIFRASIEELTGGRLQRGTAGGLGGGRRRRGAFGGAARRSTDAVGTMDGSPVGFASLDGNEQIDMLYVHPAAAGQGVGTMLVDALEKLAAARGARKLVGRGERQRAGFLQARAASCRSSATRCRVGDEWLANTTMEKQLAAKESAP